MEQAILLENVPLQVKLSYGMNWADLQPLSLPCASSSSSSSSCPSNTYNSNNNNNNASTTTVHNHHHPVYTANIVKNLFGTE